jgi:DNA-binding response OmpR family regulator
MSIQVLLVDDEVELAAYTAKRLSARGMQVQITHSGRSALKLMAEHSFDVIVLDLLMPEMNGFEVLREMKKARSKAQVIMLSGHMNGEAVTEGEALGAVEYILKPCEFSTLVKAIENAEKRRFQRP